MRYADFYDCDLCNGTYVGISLFVQGCPLHCKNCFNPSTWSFSGGKEWTERVEDRFMTLLYRPYIKRVSFLGGEPMADGNYETVLNICKNIKNIFNEDKKIWIYSGFDWEYLIDNKEIRKGLQYVDVLIDGRFIDEQKDLSLKFKGSSNQRIIDVQKSLKTNSVVLWS